MKFGSGRRKTDSSRRLKRSLYGERRWGMRWADDAMDVDKEDLTDNFSEEVKTMKMTHLRSKH